MTSRRALLALLLLSCACAPGRAPGDDDAEPSCPELRSCNGGAVCCEEGQVCSGAGDACVACTPTTCAAKGAQCGTIADGCGGTLSCGTCDEPSTCGGSGVPNVCGVGACQPKSCAAQGAECGDPGDGCGGPLSCGSCAQGATCGGGGAPWKCGTGQCVGENDLSLCRRRGHACGPLVDFDNCGNSRAIVSCGHCAEGSTCTPQGRCLCQPPGDEELCEANPTICGAGRATDRCGTSRAVTCPCSTAGAPCSETGTCGGELSCVDGVPGYEIPGGICTRTCESDAVCGAGGTCVAVAVAGGMRLCTARCATDGDCREGFVCSSGGCLPPAGG